MFSEYHSEKLKGQEDASPQTTTYPKTENRRQSCFSGRNFRVPTGLDWTALAARCGVVPALYNAQVVSWGSAPHAGSLKARGKPR